MGFVFSLIRGFAVGNTIHLCHGFCEHKTDQVICTCERTFTQMRPAALTCLTVGSCVLTLRVNRCPDFHEAKDMRKVYVIFETPSFLWSRKELASSLNVTASNTLSTAYSSGHNFCNVCNCNSLYFASVVTSLVVDTMRSFLGKWILTQCCAVFSRRTNRSPLVCVYV